MRIWVRKSCSYPQLFFQAHETENVGSTQSWHTKCSIRESSRISMDFPWICHRNELMSSRPRPHPTHDSQRREPTPQSSQSRPLWSFPAASGVGKYPQQRDNNIHTACLWYKKTCCILLDHIRYPPNKKKTTPSLRIHCHLQKVWLHFGTLAGT